MSPSIRVDFAPLLTPGFHVMDLEEVYQLAVARPSFRLSKTRRSIMDGLRVLTGQILRWGGPVELWLDGSFLTEKIDPEDVDLVVVLAEGFLDTATPEQTATLSWLCESTDDEAKRILFCHAFALYKTDPLDSGYGDYLYMDAYWKKTFGMSRQHQPKGMALISIKGGEI